MKFYELTHPDYNSDSQFIKMNPIDLEIENFLPSVLCSNCNEQWASSYRLRVSSEIAYIISNYLQKHRISETLELEEWNKLVYELSKMTSIPKEEFRPGMEYGVPVGILNGNEPNDFNFPFPGQMWITKKVKDILEMNKITGLEFSSTIIKRRGKTLHDYKLWEIIIRGIAWREGSNLEKITVCDICKRQTFPDPNTIIVDEKRWDGSDFFTIDLNPNIVIVTEKVKELLNEYNINNYRCIPL